MQQLLTDIEHLHYQGFLLSLLEDMNKALPKAKNDGISTSAGFQWTYEQ